VLPFREDEEAITMSNDVVYGLSSSVWTRRHLPRARRLTPPRVRQHAMYAREDFTTVRHVMADITGKADKSWHGAVMEGAQG
jgi:betaine-aldehyde dehydrogenase